MGIPRIPQSQRKNPDYVKKAQDLYKRELPRFEEQISVSTTPSDLEAVYSQFKELTLEPWAPARKHRPRRYKYFWSDRLDYLKKMRSKKYRQAANDKSSVSWAQYRAIDREIRSLLNKNKRRSRNRVTQALESTDGKGGPKVIKSILQNRTAPVSPVGGAELNLSSFTEHIATPPGKGYVPPIVPFEISPDLERKVHAAILKAKSNRATGTDELFSEAFKLAPKEFARIFSLFWVQCSKLGYLLQEWRTALLVPIYKRGPKADPSSYRPIALLSHGRQMISKAIGLMIRQEYKFHPTQLGFRESTGTETALLRHAASTQNGYRYTAVLDLKSAYPSVPRDNLMEKVTAKLTPRTAAMIALELQPETILTKGDETGTTGTISLGVPQGGSSSPPLYNVQMDSFCEKMENELRTNNPDEEVDVSVFADDVKLRSRTSRGLQRGLNVCTEWTTEENMEWCTWKCHVLEPESEQSPGPRREYVLSGSPINVSESAVYLGVTLRGTAIASDRNLDRIKLAFKRLGLLRSAGINRKFISSARLIQICRTYVYPAADYGIHLMPIDKAGKCELSSQLELLDYRVVEFALGCIPKEPVQRQNKRIGGRLPRHLKLAKLPDWLQRIRTRLQKLAVRLKLRAQLERSDLLARNDPEAFRTFRQANQSPRDMTRTDIIAAWKVLCRRLRRKISVPKSGLLPVLQEKDRRVRDAGIKWYCGSFPGNPTRLKASLPAGEYQRNLHRIQTGMLAEQWGPGLRRRTVGSLLNFVDALDGFASQGTKRKDIEDGPKGLRRKAARVTI